MKYLIGVDPSITATGLVLLGSTAKGGPGVHFKCLHRDTITTKPGDTFHRISLIAARVRLFLSEVDRQVGGWDDLAQVVLEDPTDQKLVKGGMKINKRTICVLGAATGAVMAVLDERFSHAQITSVTPGDWLPKQNGRALTREMTRALIHSHCDDLSYRPVDDDQVMAAGVAMWWSRRNPQVFA